METVFDPQKNKYFRHGALGRWLLLDNFGPPLYGQNHTPPYYQRLFEAYGFQRYFNQFTYFRKVVIPLTPE